MSSLSTWAMLTENLSVFWVRLVVTAQSNDATVHTKTSTISSICFLQLVNDHQTGPSPIVSIGLHPMVLRISTWGLCLEEYALYHSEETSWERRCLATRDNAVALFKGSI
jgi:hypothetical protein